MSYQKIFDEFVEYARAAALPMEAIAIADENRVLAEHHFVPDLARNIYSHTKSYMVTGVGIAISRGLLSLDDSLAEFFPESVPENAPDALFRIRLRHLLTMSSGFNRAYLMNADRRAGVGAPDYMKYMLSRPVETEPGSAFCYSSADSILALRMAQKAVGCRFGEFLHRELLGPMDMGYPLWEHDPQGNPNGGGGMFLHLSEMLKLGQLYLNGGVWKGRRLVENSWITQATKKQIETGGGDVWRCGYGYQFWLSPYPGSYRADGAYGQVTTVLPESGLVVAVQNPETGDFERVKMALHEMVLSRL